MFFLENNLPKVSQTSLGEIKSLTWSINSLLIKFLKANKAFSNLILHFLYGSTRWKCQQESLYQNKQLAPVDLDLEDKFSYTFSNTCNLYIQVSLNYIVYYHYFFHLPPDSIWNYIFLTLLLHLFLLFLGFYMLFQLL